VPADVRDEPVASTSLVKHGCASPANREEQSRPSLHRTELAAEAIRLTRILHRLLPNDGAVTGLLALMLLTDARRP
jgi:predicted RNA polymerase sigma factor